MESFREIFFSVLAQYKPPFEVYEMFLKEIQESPSKVSLPKINQTIDYYNFCLYSVK